MSIKVTTQKESQWKQWSPGLLEYTESSKTKSYITPSGKPFSGGLTISNSPRSPSSPGGP